MSAKDTTQIYWHREWPPLDVDGETIGEQIVEATSRRVPGTGTLAHRDELWDQCYEELRAQARDRLLQEVRRLGGTCAYVLGESIDSRHDAVSGDLWLYGCFTCVVCRRPTG